jgi:membrane-bound serine protease (ClpP class)
MRQIVQRMLRASVPVVVFVAPPGARAGSAGVFITLAADVAAMAPGTNIGAAHPVGAGPGGPGGIADPVMATKVTNDAAAYARSLAQQRGRNADWAERAVRESDSLPASEALRYKVVEEVASDVNDLLAKLDGRRLTGPWGERTLRTRGAVVFEEEMNGFERLLQTLVDPNVAYLLFTVGIYALVAEVSNPGAVVPGVVGAICLVLALVAFGSLPVNWGGVALLVVAVALFVAEVKVASHGLLGVGGLVAFVLGSLLLFAPLTPEPLGATVTLNLWLVAGLAAASALFFGWILRQALAVRRAPALWDQPRAGEVAIAQTSLAPTGSVHLRGESWSAEVRGGTIEAGAPVRVIAREGLTLLVEPVEREAACRD